MASAKVVTVAAGLRRGKEGLSSWEASGKPCLPLPVTASGSADLPSSAGARQVADESRQEIKCRLLMEKLLILSDYTGYA